MTYPTTIDEYAPIVAGHTIRIAAPLERVWQLHTRIGSWPDWQPAITEARLDGPIAPGTTFHWLTAGMSINSTIYAVDAPHRILWGGLAHGITGLHEWTFTEDGDVVVVRTRESWAGTPVDADRDNLAAVLDDSLSAWLDALKKTAE
ncbi:MULTISPECIES: SRPBCC family protein [Streptomyces violaceusniger group]|uniref:Shy6-polyketide cyclase n=2 Tax=Streptomyces javensis TaxID=114698 RepID=A0ABN1X9W0_9ACTN|nr:SRPBCC family protein [Streptomyces javensis]MBI0312674.1 SRPBCC family protein [Streptomyces javensis]